MPILSRTSSRRHRDGDFARDFPSGMSGLEKPGPDYFRVGGPYIPGMTIFL